MIIDAITIFPKMFFPVLGEAIIKRAVNKGLVKINVHNLRDYVLDRHKKVDAPSYGGRGMVFKSQPLFSAVEEILGWTVYPCQKNDINKRIILFTPKGETLSQRTVKKFLDYERLILIVPRYEDVDERVREHLAEDEISIGDYVTSGAELPAMVFMDCLVRLLPGVVSDKESIKRESFEQARLDYPHYTSPRDFRGLKVPDVLLSGNHKEIEAWRQKKALEETQKKRPDLLK